MPTKSDLLAAAEGAVLSRRTTTLPIIADMVEEMGYTQEFVLFLLRNPHRYDGLEWWALKKVLEHFGEEQR